MDGNDMKQRAVDRYGPVAQVLHWATAILVMVAFVYGPGGSEEHVYAADRDFDRQLHETLGLCVFALTAIRVLWMTVDTRPTPSSASHWMSVAAKLVQAALYLLLFMVPLTAVAGAWLEEHPLTLLGDVTISFALKTPHDVGATVAEVHTWLGDAILWVAGLHAFAGLCHHFYLQDSVFMSMLPRLPFFRNRNES